MWLRNKLIEDVHATVDEIFYLDWSAAQRFNEKRDKDQPLVFSGWYWALGAQEGGPFKSKSSAYRDAWYRLVLRRAPPSLHRGRKRAAHLKLVRSA